ncbi:hypothetical protein DB347_02185 [Opitutaceae bacterium EW11]|nr:hypothetical protein DB347_02185 [Opitutaceae bacterium EW11]
MSTNRRTFLKTSVALAASASFARFALAQPSAHTGKAAPAPGSRGLLFDSADLPRLRANLQDPRCAEIRGKLLGLDHGAERRFLREELRLNNCAQDLLRARQILEHAALAFALTESGDALTTARLALQRICEYPRWDYFLEGGTETIGFQRAPEATLAVCFALDWLGDRLTDEERRTAEAQVASKGAPPCYRSLYGMKYPDRVRGWTMDPDEHFPYTFDLKRWPLILNATNLKVIPIAALGIAAICLKGRHPDADKWLEMARQSARAFSTMYGLDGAYDEGAGYWGYTTQHLILFAEVLHRKLGIDDRKLINYPGTIRYAVAMSMPCGGKVVSDPHDKVPYNGVPKVTYDPARDMVNFSDAGGMDMTSATWVGHTADDPLSNYAAKHIGSLREFQALFWYRPDAPETPPGNDLLDVRLSNDWVISRTGWKPEDGVVALRSGGPSNHEHADRNSVIFKVHGERLFHDPFKAGYSPATPRWLLRQTEAHTAVLLDGRGHQYHHGEEGTNASWASARIADFRSGPGWLTVTSDATEAYALVHPQAKRVARTLLFLKPDVLVIVDRIRLASALPVQLRFQVFNEDGRGRAACDGARFTIQRPLAGLHGLCVGLAPLTARTGLLALPQEEGQYPYVEVVSPAAADHLIVTASTAVPGEAKVGNLSVVRKGNIWRITGVHLSRSIDASIDSTPDDVPVVSVES